MAPKQLIDLVELVDLIDPVDLGYLIYPIERTTKITHEKTIRPLIGVCPSHHFCFRDSRRLHFLVIGLDVGPVQNT